MIFGNFHRCVARLLIFLQLFMSFQALADEYEDAGRSGSSFANELINGLDISTTTTGSDGSIDFGATYQDGTPIQPLSAQEISTSTPLNEEFPDGPVDQTTFQNYYDSEEDGDMILNAQLRMSPLYQDAIKADPTTTGGSVYSTLLRAKDYQRTDLRNDPLTAPTREFYENLDLEGAGFTDCTRTTTLNTVENTTHVEDLKYCTISKGPGSSCTINNVLTSNGIIEVVDVPANIAYCPDDRNCLLGWIGSITRGYGGGCSIYEEEVAYRVLDPDRIDSVVIDYAKYDDYFQMYTVNTVTGQETLLWDGPNVGTRSTEGATYNGPEGLFPPETSGSCELGNSWYDTLSINITPSFKNVAPGTVVKFKSRVSVTGDGEAYGRFRVKYKPFDKNQNQTLAATLTNDQPNIYQVDANTTEFVLQNQPVDLHQFKMQVVDTDGLASDFTSIKSKKTTASDNTITLRWNRPTTRMDGGPLLPEEIQGYVIYHMQSLQSCMASIQSIQETGLGDISCSEYFDPVSLDCTKQGYYGLTCQENLFQSCTLVNGEIVCASDMDTINVDGISPLCKSVEVTSSTGSGCGVDENGDPACIENFTPSGDSDGCRYYEENEQCAYISQECQEGSTLPNGECAVLKKVYDCGYDATWNDLDPETNFECAGILKCLGDDCRDINPEESTSFVKAATLLQAEQFASMDNTCIEGTTAENVTCEVFKGEAYKCKTAVFGVQKCCIDPAMTSLGTYFELMGAVGVLNASIQGLGALATANASTAGTVEAIQGGWSALGDGAYSATVGSFTSAWDGIVGVDSALSSEVLGSTIDYYYAEFTDAAAQLGAEALAQMGEMLGLEIGSSAASACATAAACSAAGENLAMEKGGQVAAQQGSLLTDLLGPQMAGYASAALTAVAVVAVAYLAIQLVFECEESELQLSAKRGMNACNRVGDYCSLANELGVCLEMQDSYCCYNSPLSAIIMEQLRPQLGGYGDPKNPQCGGIPLDQMDDIDWSQLDLDKWTGILVNNNILPDVEDLTMENLTGDGHAVQVGGRENLNALETVERQMEGAEVDDVRMDLQDNTPVYTGGP